MTRTPAPAGRRWIRGALLAAAPLAALTLTACSGSGARLGLPVAATAEAPNVGNLWLGAWIASFVGELLDGRIDDKEGASK